MHAIHAAHPADSVGTLHQAGGFEATEQITVGRAHRHWVMTGYDVRIRVTRMAVVHTGGVVAGRKILHRVRLAVLLLLLLLLLMLLLLLRLLMMAAVHTVQTSVPGVSGRVVQRGGINFHYPEATVDCNWSFRLVQPACRQNRTCKTDGERPSSLLEYRHRHTRM